MEVLNPEIAIKKQGKNRRRDGKNILCDQGSPKIKKQGLQLGITKVCGGGKCKLTTPQTENVRSPWFHLLGVSNTL